MDIFNICIGIGAIAICVCTIGILLLRNNGRVKQFLREYGVMTAFLITFLAVFGSLSYSSLWGLVPCPLCWYQRIVMFPLPILFLTALVKKDARVWLYTTPLALIGLIISGYQSLLQTGLFGQSPFCEPGSIESCSVPEFLIFGFITIPLMSFIVFLSVTVISFLARRVA